MNINTIILLWIVLILVLVPTQPPSQWVPGAFTLEIRQQGV